jgi:hypothetical protein
MIASASGSKEHSFISSSSFEKLPKFGKSGCPVAVNELITRIKRMIVCLG